MIFGICLMSILLNTIYAQGPNSCVGHCGSSATNCWCNDQCESHHDCCSDYKEVCGSELMHLKILTQYPKAQCLDGSNAGYYFRNSSSGNGKFLLYFEGGGWCYDTNCKTPTRAGTLANCRDRSKTSIGSSKSWAKTKSQTGSMSANREENPVFYDWNVVYMPYCDGTSFSGNVDSDVDGLFFRGKIILESIINDLKKNTNIQKAKQVVVSGGSAGASAVYYHVDKMVEMLALDNGEVLAMPDAGFFLDLPDKDGVDCWPNQMRSVWDISNGYEALHEGCLERFSSNQYKCLFPQYYTDLLKTPIFLIQSLYDSSELWYTLNLSCCPAGCESYPTCKGTLFALFQKMRQQHIDAWSQLVTKAGNGIWAPACIAHTLTWGEWTNTTWEVPAHSGNTMATSVERWLTKNNSDHKNWQYQDAVSWPSNSPCHTAD